MDKKKSVIVFIIIFMMFLSSVAGGLTWYIRTKDDKKTSNISNNASNTSNTSKTTTILSTANVIQLSEINTQLTSSAPMSTPPKTPTSGPAKFSFMMDLKVDGTYTTWRNVFTHGPDMMRNPALFVTAEGTGVFISFGDNSKTVPTPSGTYFNVLVVSDGTKMDIYINKTKVDTITGTFNWTPISNDRWTWTNDKYGASNAPVYVKNFYWWNKDLTAADITSLSSTTSKYMSFMKNDNGITGYDDGKYAVLN